MPTLIYLDTNIYLDHLDGRTDHLRPLGEFAFELLRRTFQCEFKIVLSSLVLDELNFLNYTEKIKELLSHLKELDKLVYLEETEEDVKEASQIVKESKTSWNDTKHAVLAKRASVGFFVTRNIKDFENLQHLIEVKLPEEL